MYLQTPACIGSRCYCCGGGIARSQPRRRDYTQIDEAMGVTFESGWGIQLLTTPRRMPVWGNPGNNPFAGFVHPILPSPRDKIGR